MELGLKIIGELKIGKNPITGIQPLTKEWLFSKDQAIRATIRIETKDDFYVYTPTTKSRILKLILGETERKAKLIEIHFGLNQLKITKELPPIPIITRIHGFAHLGIEGWIPQQNKKNIYYIFMKEIVMKT